MNHSCLVLHCNLRWCSLLAVERPENLLLWLSWSAHQLRVMRPSPSIQGACVLRVLSKGLPGGGHARLLVCVPVCTLRQCKVLILHHCHLFVVEFLLKEISEERHFFIFHFGICVINHLLTVSSFMVPVWNFSSITYFKNHLKIVFEMNFLYSLEIQFLCLSRSVTLFTLLMTSIWQESVNSLNYSNFTVYKLVFFCILF